MSNIETIVKNNLCIGCSLCANICPTSSINIRYVNGEYKPEVNINTCNQGKGCKLCSSICPGKGVSFNDFVVSDEKKHFHKNVGYYISAYSSYAKDNETRYHGSSGGTLTAVLAYLLDEGIISAAVVAKNDLKESFLNKVVLIRDSKDLYKARGTKYCPVSYDGIIQQIKNESGRVAIVGLPCVLHGIKKYEKLDKKLKDKIYAHFGLYCSGGRTFNLTEYTFKKHGISKESLTYFQYRDNGCLGSMEADDGYKKLSIPYQMYYHPLRSIFIPQRCLFCIDHFAELSDISFGDIHVGEYINDKIGVNSIVVRTEAMNDIILDAAKKGYIELSQISEKTLVECQESAWKKKGRTFNILSFCSLIGVTTPTYDVEIKKKISPKSILYYFFARFQMFIGKRRWLWWMIPLIARKGIIK